MRVNWFTASRSPLKHHDEYGQFLHPLWQQYPRLSKNSFDKGLKSFSTLIMSGLHGKLALFGWESNPLHSSMPFFICWIISDGNWCQNIPNSWNQVVCRPFWRKDQCKSSAGVGPDSYWIGRVTNSVVPVQRWLGYLQIWLEQQDLNLHITS